MSYAETKYLFSPSWLNETDLTVADNLIAVTMQRKVTVVSINFLVTTALGTFTTQVPVLAISHTPAGATITEKDTITLVASSAVGTMTKGAGTNVPFDCNAGDVLTFSVKTAGSGGTTTGAGYWVLELKEWP